MSGLAQYTTVASGTAPGFQTAQTGAMAGIDLSRLAATFERLFCDFAAAQMARHPELARELCRRCSNVMARRRAVVAATQMDLVLRRFIPASPPPPPPA